MLKKILLSVLLFAHAYALSAQNISIQGKIAKGDVKTITIAIPKLLLNHNELLIGEISFHVDSNNSFSKQFQLREPVIAYLRVIDKVAKKYANYNLFLSPGDQLNIEINTQNKPMVSITGEGAENNQYLPLDSWFVDTAFEGDTLPDRVYKAIKIAEIENRKVLEQYIRKHHPRKAFIQAHTSNLNYFAAYFYYNFTENNKYSIRASYERNIDTWDTYKDSLFSKISINNPNAMNAPNYLRFISTFLLRKKEQLWKESSKNPEKFVAEWYKTDVKTGMKLFNYDMQNLLTSKIIERYFAGQCAEFAYAVLFENAMESQKTENVVTLFKDFRQKFPNSMFIAPLTPFVNEVEKRQNRELSDKMVFVENGEQLHTFEEVLELVKGKTVLLDMWGTWCGPCRSEIEKHTAKIKSHFKGKDLNYLYVANFDSSNKEKWKELIAYFNLEGMHILANPKLTKDIMTKTKSSGYPTYLILKKDGSFEQSEAGYPMQREILIKQLEEALAMPN